MILSLLENICILLYSFLNFLKDMFDNIKKYIIKLIILLFILIPPFFISIYTTLGSVYILLLFTLLIILYIRYIDKKYSLNKFEIQYNQNHQNYQKHQNYKINREKINNGGLTNIEVENRKKIIRNNILKQSK